MSVHESQINQIERRILKTEKEKHLVEHKLGALLRDSHHSSPVTRDQK